MQVGDFVSTNPFVCKTTGCLPTGYGGDSSDYCYQGSTIYNDATSSLIWFENQISLGSNDILVGKSQFEKCLWHQATA